jgi:hypothetical protein
LSKPPALTDPYAGGDSEPPSSEAPASSEGPASTPESARIGSPIHHGLLPKGPPPRPRKRTRRRPRRWRSALLAIGLASGLIGLSLLGYLGYQRLLKSSPGAVFPLNHPGSLPANTVAVQRFTRTNPPGFVDHEAALWSYLAATFCGGEDLFRALANSDNSGFREEAARMLREPRATRDSLLCGRSFADVADEDTFVIHALGEPSLPSETDEQPKAVPSAPIRTATLMKLKRREAPKSRRQYAFAREALGLGEVRCLVEDPAAITTCSPASPASAHLEGTDYWLGGSSLDTIVMLGRTLSPTKGNEWADPTDLTALAAKVSSAQRAAVGKGAFMNPDFLRLMGVNAHEPPEVAALIALLADKDALFAEADDVSFAGGRYKLFLLASQAPDAIDIEQGLRALHEAVLSPESEHSPKRDQAFSRFERAQHEAGVRAIKLATVERDERWVIASYEVSLNDEQREATQEWLLEQNQRRAGAAEIIDQLVTDEPISNEALVRTGGAALLDRVRRRQ